MSSIRFFFPDPLQRLLFFDAPRRLDGAGKRRRLWGFRQQRALLGTGTGMTMESLRGVEPAEDFVERRSRQAGWRRRAALNPIPRAAFRTSGMQWARAVSFRRGLPSESTPDRACAYPACRPRFRFGRFGRAARGCWLLGGREELCGVFGPSYGPNRFSSSAIFANKNRTTAWASGGHFEICCAVICSVVPLFCGCNRPLRKGQFPNTWRPEA